VFSFRASYNCVQSKAFPILCLPIPIPVYHPSIWVCGTTISFRGSSTTMPLESKTIIFLHRMRKRTGLFIVQHCTVFGKLWDLAEKNIGILRKLRGRHSLPKGDWEWLTIWIHWAFCSSWAYFHIEVNYWFIKTWYMNIEWRCCGIFLQSRSARLARS
jgi:hypothetical protein